MYFPSDWDTVTDLIARSKVDYDSPDKLEGGSPYEQVFQSKSALIALYDIEEGTRFPIVSTLFSRDLKNREEHQSGWIFAEAGPVYLAYRPFAPGEWKEVDWTGLLRGGAGGWFSTNFAEIAEGSQCFVSDSLHNGYILQVAPASGFESYGAFKRRILELPVEITLDPVPSARFTSLEGERLEARYGEAPKVDGDAVDYSAWKLFDGPYAQAERGSEDLKIRFETERYALDFKRLSIESSVEGKAE